LFLLNVGKLKGNLVVSLTPPPPPPHKKKKKKKTELLFSATAHKQQKTHTHGIVVIEYIGSTARRLTNFL